MFSISWQDIKGEVREVIGTQPSIDSLYWLLKAHPDCIYIFCRETLSGMDYTPGEKIGG